MKSLSLFSVTALSSRENYSTVYTNLSYEPGKKKKKLNQVEKKEKKIETHPTELKFLFYFHALMCKKIYFIDFNCSLGNLMYNQHIRYIIYLKSSDAFFETL